MEYYELVNKNIILADRAKLFDNFLFKCKGLMFSKPLKKGQALILASKDEGILETTIHMFFVFFSIDIIWLNKDKIVVDKKEKVKPFIPWLSPRKAAKYVLELPKNTAKHIKLGDLLEIKKINPKELLK